MQPNLFLRTLDRFIPEILRNEIDTHLRSRTLISILLFNVAIAPVIHVLIYYSRSVHQDHLSRGHLIFSISTLLAIYLLWYFKHKGKLHLVANIYISSFYLSTIVPILLLENIPTAIIQALYLLPAIAFMICNFRSALLWTTLAITSHIGCLLWLTQPIEAFLLAFCIAFIIYLVLAATYGSHNLIQRNMGQQLQHERNILVYQAHHDALTQLANRSSAESFLASSLALAAKNQEKIGLMYLDLNKFKPVNDTHGHLVGDKLLQEIAKILQTKVRHTDMAARIGGDEFAIILRDASSIEDVKKVAEKILSSVSKPIAIEEHILEVGLSIGICISPDHGKEADELWSKADKAMYRAKNLNIGMAIYRPEDGT